MPFSRNANPTSPMRPGFPEDFSRGGRTRHPLTADGAPLRCPSASNQRCGFGTLAAGCGPARLTAALLGSLLLVPAAGAPAQVPGAAVLLGGAVQRQLEGNRLLPDATADGQTKPAGPGPTPIAALPAGADPSRSSSSAAPSAAEPGVLVPQDSGRGAAPGPPASDDSRRELVLDRQRRQLVLMENGAPLRRFPVAVGMPGWETPVGRFTVIDKQANPVWEHPVSGLRIQPGPENPLGSRWIGFYRDCRGRRGFNGKEQLVVQGCVVAGFHGTPNRASIGRAASHGCVRLYDEHVRDLFDLVRLGTPVTVLP